MPTGHLRRSGATMSATCHSRFCPWGSPGFIRAQRGEHLARGTAENGRGGWRPGRPRLQVRSPRRLAQRRNGERATCRRQTPLGSRPFPPQLAREASATSWGKAADTQCAPPQLIPATRAHSPWGLGPPLATPSSPGFKEALLSEPLHSPGSARAPGSSQNTG